MFPYSTTTICRFEFFNCAIQRDKNPNFSTNLDLIRLTKVRKVQLQYSFTCKIYCNT